MRPYVTIVTAYSLDPYSTRCSQYPQGYIDLHLGLGFSWISPYNSSANSLAVAVRCNPEPLNIVSENKNRTLHTVTHQVRVPAQPGQFHTYYSHKKVMNKPLF